MRYLITVFITVFLAELGDKTQLAVLLYSSRGEVSKWGVMIAGSLALVTATVIAVLLGDRLGNWLNPRVVSGIAGIGFLIIGSVILVGLLRR